MKAWGKENNNTLAAGFSPLPSLCPSPPHLKFGRDRPPAPTFGPWLGICWDDFDTSSGWLYLEIYQDEVGIVFGMLQDIRVCFRTSFDPQSKMKLESTQRNCSNSQKAHVAWSKHHGFLVNHPIMNFLRKSHHLWCKHRSCGKGSECSCNRSLASASETCGGLQLPKHPWGLVTKNNGHFIYTRKYGASTRMAMDQWCG